MGTREDVGGGTASVGTLLVLKSPYQEFRCSLLYIAIGLIGLMVPGCFSTESLDTYQFQELRPLPVALSALQFDPLRVTSIEIDIEDRGSLMLRRKRDGVWLNTATGGVHQIPNEVSEELIQMLSQLACTHIALDSEAGYRPENELVPSMEISVMSRDFSRKETITIGQQVHGQFRLLDNRAAVGGSSFVVSSRVCEELLRLITPFLRATGVDGHP